MEMVPKCHVLSAIEHRQSLRIKAIAFIMRTTAYLLLPTALYCLLPLNPAKNYKTRNALLPYNRGVSPPGSFEMIVNYGANR